MSLMSISTRGHRTARLVRRLLALSLVVLVATAVAGCQTAPTPTPIVQVVVITATPAPATAPVPTEKPAEGASLQVDGPAGSRTFSLEELKTLPVTEGWGGTKSSTGKITTPTLFRGVALEDLAKLAGTFDASTALNVVAKDGYATTFSYDQITTGAFTAFDPGTGDELKRAEPLKVIVAYERDGQPIPEESDGSLRLAIVTPKNDQVTDGHWAVKWVRQIVLKPASAEWTLHLEGAIVEEMDRNTFESGAAPNCHLAQWADADGKVWSGIPLYYLMGRVDDVVRHEGDAFDAPLAEKGYEVDVVAADGYKVTFDSAWLTYNKTVILAIFVDGEPLPEDVFPLRLVGSSLKKSEMVGAVAQIVLHVDQVGAAVPEPTTDEDEPTATEDSSAAGKPDVAALQAGTLHTYGKLAMPIAYTQEELVQLGMTKLTAEHPKKGPTEYEGVLLTTLLERSQPEAGATVVVFTASDGYSAEVPLADVLACADCLVILDGEGFALIMPGQSSGAWVKDVRLIEVK